MAIPGVLVWSVAPPSATHFLSSRYRILVSPTLHVPFPPLPSPSPSTTPPSNPVVSATCACPGRGRGGCERGGGEGWKLRNVSLFNLRGGCAGLIASFLPWKPNWDVLGCETQHVCWKSKGEKRRGGPIRISAGLLCWYLFLVVSFFFFLLLWARFAGADCNFLLVFGYVSVGIYLQS